LLHASLLLAVLLAQSVHPCAVRAGVLLSSLDGTCFDEDGKPMAGAIFRFTDPANGRHFEVTSNAQGKFSHNAIEPSRYRLDLIRAHHQQISFAKLDLQWSSHPLLLEINLQRNSLKVIRQVLLAEAFQTESLPPAVSGLADTDAAMVLAINHQLAKVRAFMDVGDWESAREAAKAASAIDPRRDLTWAWLAHVDCSQASHMTDSADAPLQNCIQSYGSAIAIAPNSTYCNNLGAAYSSLKQWSDAAEAFRTAVQLNPEHAALYHQNLGAALLKQAEGTAGHDSERMLRLATEAFSQAASSVPPILDAYYWKGLCQLRLAALEAAGASYKLAEDSFRQYLQADPSGPYASEARAMVDGLKNMVAGKDHSELKP
jgi:tetratricopeptide (TPR) repeat protein